MCATMIWPLHSAATRSLHKVSVSEMKRKIGGLQWCQWNEWNTNNYNLNYSQKESGVWWFPPHGSSRLHNRYQCIKLTYPGFYFATLSAEKQAIPLRPLHSHTATAESSDLASVSPLWLIHVKVGGKPARYSTAVQCQTRMLFVQMEFLSSLRSSVI